MQGSMVWHELPMRPSQGCSIRSSNGTCSRKPFEIAYHLIQLSNQSSTLPTCYSRTSKPSSAVKPAVPTAQRSDMMHSAGDLFRHSRIKILASYIAHDLRVVDLNSESCRRKHIGALHATGCFQSGDHRE